MFAKTLWILLAMALFVVPVRAEQIKIAYSGVSASGTPLWLAKEEGIFTKHGLEAELITVRSAPIQVSALVSNEVQFVRGSASSMLTAAAQGSVCPGKRFCLRLQRKVQSSKFSSRFSLNGRATIFWYPHRLPTPAI